MTAGSALVVFAVLTPLGLLAATLAAPGWRGGIARLIPVAPLPGLLAALFAGDASASLPAPLALSLALDRPGALLLGAAAFLWCAAAAAAAHWWGERMRSLPFQSWWLATLTGSMAVFMAADIVTFYIAFSLVSLAGYGLVTREGSESALRAGRVYFSLAVLGEAFLLAGLVVLVAPSGDMRIAALVAAPSGAAGLLIVLAGLGAKMGLVPLHLWMPVSYRAAPFPAAAVLSGAAVNAGIIGLLRFLPFASALPEPGVILATIGFISAFFGVAIGLMQRDPKAVLAYSSISQMGLVAAVAGLFLAAGAASAPIDIAFYAMHHAFAKGGLFLALAALALTGKRYQALVFWPAVIVALGIAGLPLTGGALAKLAIKDAFATPSLKLLGSLSAVGSTMLMLHFLALARESAATDAEARAPATILGAWWAVALAAILAPWLTNGALGGNLGEAVKPSALFELGWPLVAGGALYWVLRKGRRWPEIPPGDILTPLLRLKPRFARLADAVAAAEAWLTGWTVATTVLLALAAALAGAMVLAR